MKAALYFADEGVKQAFLSLASAKAEDREVFDLLNAAFDTIARDAFCGTQIQKHLIPQHYRAKYSIDNLWKYNLSKNWRLTYSVAGDGTDVIALILEWLPHKEYERRFGY